MVAGAAGGAPQGDNFGVGGRIARDDGAIAPPGQEESIPHDDGSDWDLAPQRGSARQTESTPHPQIGDIEAEQATPPSGREGAARFAPAGGPSLDQITRLPPRQSTSKAPLWVQWLTPQVRVQRNSNVPGVVGRSSTTTGLSGVSFCFTPKSLNRMP